MTRATSRSVQYLHLQTSLAVWNSTAKGTDKLVLLGIASFANATRPADPVFPSIATLAQRCGLKEQTVRNAIGRLEESGLLRVEHRERKTSLYFLQVSATPEIGGTPEIGHAYSRNGEYDYSRNGESKENLNIKKEILLVDESSVDAKGSVREDVETLCTTLRDYMIRNGSKSPRVGRVWHNAARLLLDADKRPFQEALTLIEWSQTDAFWRSVILSMPKFRDKYDALRLKRQSTPTAHYEPPRKEFWAEEEDL